LIASLTTIAPLPFVSMVDFEKAIETNEKAQSKPTIEIVTQPEPRYSFEEIEDGSEKQNYIHI